MGIGTAENPRMGSAALTRQNRLARDAGAAKRIGSAHQLLQVLGLRRVGLQPTSFELGLGECIAVRGPSGAGKTLLLRALADLDPNDGELCLDGQRREQIPAPIWRRLVAYVPSESGWWAETVGAHFGDWSAAGPLVEVLGLPASCQEWPVLRLSTGERQRLALVRALLLRPRVMLLDEPTSGVDPDLTLRAEELVAKHLQSGAGALWVTHDAEQARRVARRLLTIERGCVREQMP